MLKLLIAVDGSDQALRAVDWCARMARGGVPVQAVLLHVRHLPVQYGEISAANVAARWPFCPATNRPSAL